MGCIETKVSMGNLFHELRLILTWDVLKLCYHMLNCGTFARLTLTWNVLDSVSPASQLAMTLV